MIFPSIKFTLILLFVTIAAQAQLAVTVFPVKVAGQKVLIPLTLANRFPTKIESARAVCFLLDDQGTMIGQTAKWVIGQNKTGLAPDATNRFNFVITSPRPFVATNLIAKVSFSRVVLEGGKLADVRQQVLLTNAKVP